MKSELSPGTLYLIPTIISDDTQHDVLSPAILKVLPRLDHFLVENARTARRFFSSLKIFPAIDALQFDVLDKDTPFDALTEMFAPMLAGKDAGLLSESGCPGVADPGALAVSYAHRHNIQVVPLVGPSSLLLALMGSGLNGQRFAFHGYLPVQEKELSLTIRELEKESAKRDQTQIVIETPYRNNRTFSALLKGLQPATRLTVAVDLTGQHQQLQTKTIREWKAAKPDLPKLPAVFLFLAK